MKNKLFWSVISLIVIGVVWFSCYWLVSGAQRLQSKLNHNFFALIVNKLDEVIIDPHCTYGINNPVPQVDATTVCKNSMYWIEKGYKIGLHSGRSEEVSAPNQIHLDLAFIKPELDRYFRKSGFVTDDINTRITLIDTDINDYNYAYTKGSLDCLVSFYEITSQGVSNVTPFWAQVACGSITDEDRRIFSGYFNAANPKKDRDLVFFLSALDGNYARLTTYFTRTGSELLVKKEQGEWIAPFGPIQEYPLCKDVDRLGFPKSVYKNCMLDNYSLRQKN